jgi:glycosyltransferase involved in cell wall biosynthesis
MRLEKTVLQVVPALDEGGAERTSVEMTRAIVAAGGRALIATAGGRMEADIEAAGGRVLRMPAHSKNPATMLVNSLRLARIIREEHVDLIHARSRAPAWSALAAARATRIPFVSTYHGAYATGSPLKRFYNSAMARADLVIANSAFTAESIRRSYRKAGPMAVIPRGADLVEFDPAAVAEARREALRTRWGLQNRRALILLLPARLTGWKGHRVAIEALARLVRLAAAYPRTGADAEFQLIFAGDQRRGGLVAALQRLVGELGIQHMTRWVGHCEDMPAAYSLADIVLAPSTRPEAFGRVAVEAGAMERPVIASDHGGARETVVQGETGLLVEPGSPDSLADAIAAAIALGSEGRRAMGARARARIAAGFSIEAMTRRTLAAYRDLLERSQASA